MKAFGCSGVAWKAAGTRIAPDRADDEADLVFAGFAAFEDPPKASAAVALTDLARRGVAVKVLRATTRS